MPMPVQTISTVFYWPYLYRGMVIIPTIKVSGGSIMLWDCFKQEELEIFVLSRTTWIEPNIRNILRRIQSARNLCPRQRFTQWQGPTAQDKMYLGMAWAEKKFCVWNAEKKSRCKSDWETTGMQSYIVIRWICSMMNVKLKKFQNLKATNQAVIAVKINK